MAAAAGTHLLIDLWGAQQLDDVAHIEQALLQAAQAAGATVLHCHLHHFQAAASAQNTQSSEVPAGFGSAGTGVTGVLLLAESHISIHTWPERGFAAVDVFMCGACDPHACVPVLQQAFAPQRLVVQDHRRGA
ncbi:adenosylmethionine decarboxylase [Curvibacter sp. CHRR-16]|nr:adenosylmethionine decarboxylase [Curvibacter sp. CHRR-16]